jgi:WD40 repeat protein
MAGTLMQAKHLFGFKSDVANCVIHVDDHRVAYVSGHNVVSYSTEDRSMQFYPGIEGTITITALALSANRRFLAVAERARTAIVSIFDMSSNKKKRTMTTTDCASEEYVSMAFPSGSENKFLATQGGAPDWTLVLWQWDRTRVVSTAKIAYTGSVCQVSFNILDYSLGIVCTGNANIKCHKITEGQLKQQAFNGLAKKENHVSSTNYLCHSWLFDGKLVVGTDANDILVFDQNYELKVVLLTLVTDWASRVICPFAGGFLVGGDLGQILIFERNPEDLRNQYAKTRSINIARYPDARIKGLSMSPQGDFLVIGLDTSQVLSLAFNADRDEPSHLVCSFHHLGITGLDVCIRKPLIATCGLDKSVRIWNYIDGTLETEDYFAEDPFSIAFHPSGLHIIVGFADKLRIMNVFANSVKSFKEIPIKACREVRFCNGGHMFAASNGHLIQVFNFYTADNPQSMQFKGHTNKVRAIAWSEDDLGFVSAGWDGTIYEWRFFMPGEISYVQEYTQKGINFSSVLVTPGKGPDKSVFAVSNDRIIREIVGSKKQRVLETGTLYGQIALANSARFMYAGSSEPERPGSLRAYNFSPLTGDYSELQAHSLPIEKIRVSTDDCYVFTVSQDGSLCIFEVFDKEIRAAKREKDNSGLVFADEILMSIPNIEELNSRIKQLHSTNQDLEATNKMQFDVKLSEKQEQVDKLKDQILHEQLQSGQLLKSLSDSKTEMEQNYEERLRQIRDQHHTDKHDKEISFEHKIKIEVARYQDLSKEKDQELRTAAEKVEALLSNHTKMMTELSSQQHQLVDSLSGEVDQLTIDKSSLDTRFERVQAQLEEVNERQIEGLRDFNDREIQEVKKLSLEAKKKLNLVRKEHSDKQIEYSDQQEAIKILRDKISKHEDSIQQLRRDRENMKKDISERDKTIKDKKRRIFELKKKNQELDKFKFVLDYKIRELKKDIGPREEEIARLKEQTSDMEKELKHLTAVNEHLALIVEDMRMRQDGMRNEVDSQDSQLKEIGQETQYLRDSIYDCVQYITDHNKLKEAILGLYGMHVRQETIRKVETNSQQENAQQRKYLEETVKGLKEKLKSVTMAHKRDSMRIMKENVDLIKEINDLTRKQREILFMKAQVESAQKMLKTVPKEDEARRQIESQKETIRHLQARLQEVRRSSGQSRLPPLDS